MNHSTLTLGDAGGNFPFCSHALRPRGQSQMFFFGGPTISWMPAKHGDLKDVQVCVCVHA